MNYQDKENLKEELKKHLQQVDNKYTSEVYLTKLKQIIKNLDSNAYETPAGDFDSEDLIKDLQSVGFNDRAQEIRRGMFK